MYMETAMRDGLYEVMINLDGTADGVKAARRIISGLLGIEEADDDEEQVGDVFEVTLDDEDEHEEDVSPAQLVYLNKRDYARFCDGRQVMALMESRNMEHRRIIVASHEIMAQHGEVLLVEKHY